MLYSLLEKDLTWCTDPGPFLGLVVFGQLGAIGVAVGSAVRLEIVITLLSGITRPNFTPDGFLALSGSWSRLLIMHNDALLAFCFSWVIGRGFSVPS